MQAWEQECPERQQPRCVPPEAAVGRTNPDQEEVVGHLLGQADVFAGRQGDFIHVVSA